MMVGGLAAGVGGAGGGGGSVSQLLSLHHQHSMQQQLGQQELYGELAVRLARQGFGIVPLQPPHPQMPQQQQQAQQLQMQHPVVQQLQSELQHQIQRNQQLEQVVQQLERNPQPEQLLQRRQGGDGGGNNASGGMGIRGEGRAGGGGAVENRYQQCPSRQQLDSQRGGVFPRGEGVGLGGLRGDGQAGGEARGEGGHGARLEPVQGYADVRVLCYVREGSLVGVMDPGRTGGRNGTMLTRPPRTCSIVWVPLIHAALLYDREWTDTLGRNGAEGRDFLNRLEQCVRGWERVFPNMFRRWAQVIGRSQDSGVRQARGTVGRGVVGMLRASETRHPVNCVLLLPFPDLEEARTVGWAPYHSTAVQEACMGALTLAETTLMESCLAVALGITGLVVRDQSVMPRMATPRSGDRGGPQFGRVSVSGVSPGQSRSMDARVHDRYPTYDAGGGGLQRRDDYDAGGGGLQRRDDSRIREGERDAAPRGRSGRGEQEGRQRWGMDGGMVGDLGHGWVTGDSNRRELERSRDESIQEAVSFPQRFMVYMMGETNEFVPLEKVVRHPRERGQVDVVAMGMRNRWVTVSEAAIQRLTEDLLGKEWNEARLGACPFPKSRPRETRLPVSREEYGDLRQLIGRAGSPEDLVEGLLGADPNVRMMMADRFGIDVLNEDVAVERATQIGLREIAAELDTWERGVIWFDSPNPALRKVRVMDTGGGSSGGGGRADGLGMSGVRTRLFPEASGGSALSFATPPQFATYSGVGHGRSSPRDSAGSTAALEKALTVMIQHSMLTRQELAEFGKQGRSTDASDGGLQSMVAQQAALDRLLPWQHTWAKSADDHDRTTGFGFFMNAKSVIRRHSEHLKSNRSANTWFYTMQEQALAADSAARADMILVPRPGESVSVLEIMEVVRRWQDYIRKVMGAAARAAQDDKTLNLTAEELVKVDQFSQFLQAFETLKEYFASPTRYGENTLKIWLNIYRGVQYSLGHDVTSEQKRVMAAMGFTPFDNASLQISEGGPNAGARGCLGGRTAGGGAAGMLGGGAQGGATWTTPVTVKRDKPKKTDIREPGEYLPEGIHILGRGGHQIDGQCAECGEVGHLKAECPHAFQRKYGRPIPGFKVALGGESTEQLRMADYYAPGGGASDKVLKEWARHAWAPDDKTFEDQLQAARTRAHFWEGWRPIFSSL